MGNVYFGVKKTEKFFLDEEKKQYIEYKKLNEGELSDFQDSDESTMKVNQETKVAEFDTKVGKMRENLIGRAVVGFSILFGDTSEERVFTTKADWELLYREMDADLAQKLYDAIANFNGLNKKK